LAGLLDAPINAMARGSKRDVKNDRDVTTAPSFVEAGSVYGWTTPLAAQPKTTKDTAGLPEKMPFGPEDPSGEA